MYSDHEAHSDEIIPEEMPLNIQYEDDQVMIINKPVGLVVHPASGNFSGTLINGVAHYLLKQNASIKRHGIAPVRISTPY